MVNAIRWWLKNDGSLCLVFGSQLMGIQAGWEIPAQKMDTEKCYPRWCLEKWTPWKILGIFMEHIWNILAMEKTLGFHHLKQYIFHCHDKKKVVIMGKSISSKKIHSPAYSEKLLLTKINQALWCRVNTTLPPTGVIYEFMRLKTQLQLLDTHRNLTQKWPVVATRAIPRLMAEV